MNKFVFGAALAALSAAIPATAEAQQSRLPSAVIAVVDAQRIFSECNACRTAQTQLQTQAQQLEQREQQLTQPLQTEAQSLQQAAEALKGKQPDAALQQRIQSFQQRQQTANQELTRGAQTLRSTQAHVNQQIGARVGPIINSVMAARGATVVLDKSQTLAASPAIDVTADVLAQLNQQLPSVSVTPLPQQQQQQQQQQQPQGR